MDDGRPSDGAQFATGTRLDSRHSGGGVRTCDVHGQDNLWKRHADQLKSWVEPLSATDSDPTLDIEVLPGPTDPSPLPDPDAVSTSSSLDSRAPSPGGIVGAEMPTVANQGSSAVIPPATDTNLAETHERRYPLRDRRPRTW